jgi:hypothetical protein
MPLGTVDLVLLAMNAQLVRGKLFFDRALAGHAILAAMYGRGQLAQNYFLVASVESHTHLRL